MDPFIKHGVALVTGAGSGMGQQTVLKFAEHGCTRIFGVNLNRKGLEDTQRLVKEISDAANVVIHTADVSNEESVKGMIDECVRVFGRLDCAVNNAGLGQGGVRADETKVAMFDRLYSVNEKGVFLCTKREVRQMLKQEPLAHLNPSHNKERSIRGSIVHTCSLSGTAAMPNLSVYNSTKHAVAVMTKVDARQYAPDSIRVNAVSPGVVLTPMLTGAGMSDEFINSSKEQSPMNRFTFADEIAEAIVFLSGSRASGITGMNLGVDAGAHLLCVM